MSNQTDKSDADKLAKAIDVLAHNVHAGLVCVTFSIIFHACFTG